ncbi:MAG: hypothetical protein WBV55_07840 [Candidatus Sulfotelmatobacter sp.]
MFHSNRRYAVEPGKRTAFIMGSRPVYIHAAVESRYNAESLPNRPEFHEMPFIWFAGTRAAAANRVGDDLFWLDYEKSIRLFGEFEPDRSRFELRHKCDNCRVVGHSEPTRNGPPLH